MECTCHFLGPQMNYKCTKRFVQDILHTCFCYCIPHRLPWKTPGRRHFKRESGAPMLFHRPLNELQVIHTNVSFPTSHLSIFVSAVAHYTGGRGRGVGGGRVFTITHCVHYSSTGPSSVTVKGCAFTRYRF